jgi:hypothetical protein
MPIVDLRAIQHRDALDKLARMEREFGTVSDLDGVWRAAAETRLAEA